MTHDAISPTAAGKDSGRARDRWFWRLRPWITPKLRNAQYAYVDLLDAQVRTGERWLDLGCGRRLFPAWMGDPDNAEHALINRAEEVVGIDPDAEALHYNPLPIIKHLGTAQSVPEADASFDLITANMVFEHLDDPAAVLRESARLLCPGGRLILHTPNRWYPVTLAATLVPERLRRRITAWLEKRPMCDIYPTRYRMNSAAAVRRLAERAGLEVHQIDRRADTPETVPLGPLVGFEMLLIAMTRSRWCTGLRSNLIVELRKPMCAAGAMALTQGPSQNDVRRKVAA